MYAWLCTRFSPRVAEALLVAWYVLLILLTLYGASAPPGVFRYGEI